MNSLSTVNRIRRASNTNSIFSINRTAKDIYMDFSGGVYYTDFSATSRYHKSSAGLNTNNDPTTSSFALVKYRGNGLAMTDFNSTGSFSIYLKYAATTQTFPPFNFLYPNMVNLSAVNISVGQTFTARFYSFLNPGTIIPYSITGIQSSDLNGAAVSGNFTAPFYEETYHVTAAPTSSVFFDVSGGLSKPITIVVATYIVTVSAGSFVCYSSVGVVVSFPITLNTGSGYIFDQSDLTNNGYIFKLSNSTILTNNEITSGVSTNGIPGALNAYTSITPTSTVSVRPLMLYRMSISGRTILLNAILAPTITFLAGHRYIFDQSDVTNVDKPIVFSRNTSGEPTLSATDGTVTIVGIPGQTGAYTMLDFSEGFTGLLYYLIILPPLIDLRHTRISGISEDTTMTTDPANNFIMSMDYTGMYIAIIRKPINNTQAGYTYRSYQGNPVSQDKIVAQNQNVMTSLSVDSSFNIIHPVLQGDGGTNFSMLTRSNGTVPLYLNGLGLKITAFGQTPFQGFYGTARGNPVYSANLNLVSPAFKNILSGKVLQMSHTPSFSHVLFSVSTKIGEDGTTINEYTDFNSQRSVIFKISTNITTAATPTYRTIAITSVGNGLVYVSKTGAFMAISTNTHFYYSSDSFVTNTAINTGDLMNNFFKLNFYFNFNTSNWFAYNESYRIGYFLKSDDGGITSKLYTTSNFFSSEQISEFTVRRKSTYPDIGLIPNMTQSLFKTSADADYFLLYGTYDTSAGFYYVSVDINKVPQTAIVYTVTVNGGVYWISTNSADPVEKPNVTLTPGNTYVFDQSHASNVGHPLRFSITGFSPSYNTRVDISGIPGNANAFTSIEVTASTSLPLYYYSASTAGMGYVPPQLPFIWYTFKNEIGVSVRNYGVGGASYNATITNETSDVRYNLNYGQPILNDLSRNRFGIFCNSDAAGRQSFVQIPIISRAEFVNASMSLWIYIVTKSYDTKVFSTFDVANMYYFNVFLQGSSFSNSSAGIPITFNKWIHYVQVFDRTTSTRNTYIDNVLMETKINANTNMQPFGGRLMGSADQYQMLNGYIADFRFYKSALTIGEISDLYNNT